MERVACLYRVSTKGQVDKNDIPMQRIECRRFAESKSWTIVREEAELGVSGYKISAKNRDTVQLLMKDAEEGKFDVLLVYMFDRLGRREDETPFVVQWFVEHGVQVWSVQEGEQRFDTHVDKLMNYIRYWQASGESNKTSLRIQTRLHQLVEEGMYTGGNVPYGYRKVKRGRLNKKGIELFDIEVDPQEAEIVRAVFSRSVQHGHGSYRLAKSLNEMGLRTHSGAKFQCNNILRMLQCKQYIGYYVTKSATSPYIDTLRIIDDETFEQAQRIVSSRKKKSETKGEVARNTKGKTMLSGVIACANCGCKLTATTYRDKRTRKDGSIYQVEEPKYICYHRSRRLNSCDGQHAYKAEVVDNMVNVAVKRLLKRLKSTPKACALENKLQIQKKEKAKLLVDFTEKLETAAKELTALQGEVAKCLMGNSLFSETELREAIDKAKTKYESCKSEHQRVSADVAESDNWLQNLNNYYDMFSSWATQYELADNDTKKMIIGELFEEVSIGRQYTLTVRVRLSISQFFEEPSEAVIDTPSEEQCA